MTDQYDLVIVGGGPAGLAAAIEADRYGLTVIVLDDQQRVGGQIYRSVEKNRHDSIELLGDDYFYGRTLAQKFAATDVNYQSRASVWHATASGTVIYSRKNQSHQIEGKHLLLATGAMERPFPIPGWTLPGVMGAAAADTLFKSSSLVPSGKVVLAGSGPLLLLIAYRLLQSAVDLKAIINTSERKNLLTALPYFPGALKNRKLLTKGIKLQWYLMRSGVPIYRGIDQLKAQGTDKVESVSFRAGSTPQEILVDTLLLHEGVIPNTQITKLIGCEHEWDACQRYWQPITDQWGNSKLDQVTVVGDLSGISGAKTAEMSGHLAGLNIAHQLGRISEAERNWQARSYRSVLNKELAIRPFIDRLYRPNLKNIVPADDKTIVCRCEEVTAGQIRSSVDLNCVGPNQVKTQTRCGMGACQGRMCGPTSAEIVAARQQKPIEEIGYLHVRPPLKPISIEEMIGFKAER